MSIHKEALERVKDDLARLAPTCPQCGHTEKLLFENLVAPLGIGPQDTIDMGSPVPTKPLLLVTCQRCFNVQFFDAIKLGLIRPNQPVPLARLLNWLNQHQRDSSPIPLPSLDDLARILGADPPAVAEAAVRIAGKKGYLRVHHLAPDKTWPGYGGALISITDTGRLAAKAP